ncbi:hypothetical protein H0H81_007438 [Sphagnurus paluster]|uniref:Glycogenin n=1 Tax=Sphagnurus paluster TaxID=117069 RepID=A0A9P7GX87_9AGAR|nr:hypothetical protein H0H81_007438 [Sphagnurus paluster]
MAAHYAFVTLVSSDAYLPGALALTAALKDVHPTPAAPPEVPFQTVCLVTPETVDVSTVKLLRRAFDLVVGVELITQHDHAGLALLGRLDLKTVLTKLHVFRLTQFSKIIFLDADVLPLRPLSHLFTLPNDFSASPDVGWPDIFNSGVMVLSPGEDKFSELLALFKSKGSWDGGDQGILNEWRGGNWNSYAPAYERFGSEISAIHFIGPNKPWNSISYRSPFSGQSVQSANPQQQAYDYNSLVDRWYDVYDKHYRSGSQNTSHQPFEIKRYESTWNQPRGNGSITTPTSGSNPLNLEDLKRMAIGGMSAASHNHYYDSSQAGKLPAEGVYQSLPLDGRVDLMRPQKRETVAGTGTDEAPAVQNGSQSQGTHNAVEERRRVEMHTNLSHEEDPGTPTARYAAFPGNSPQRWHTLPTPGPHEIPPSSQPSPIPLPPVTPTAEYESHFPGPTQPNSPSQRSHSHLMEPPRPRSPTMLLWNPAVEPPPKDTPLSSAFPRTTYFQNAWDASPREQHSHINQQTPHRAVTETTVLFEPLPRPEIPEQLIRQGHYRNVTGGNGEHGSSPSPDKTKVKHVFPWEEKPRRLPGRVFPAADSPKPSLFLSPESQTSQTSLSEAPLTPETKHVHPPPALSPLVGLPSFAYQNAWDNVPSIKKYASGLVRPPAPRALAPAFDQDGWDRRAIKSWEEKAEASSRDGDVEDEGESDYEQAVADSMWDDESEPESASALQRRSRRGSSILATRSSSEVKKNYRDFGVQTAFPEMRTQGVQVNLLPKTRNGHAIDPDKKPTLSGRGHWAPANRPNTAPSVTFSDSGIGGRQMSRASAAPVLGPQRRSPRSSPQLPSPSANGRSPLAPPPSLPAARPSQSPTPHLRSARTPVQAASIVTRQVSGDSSLGSPASSIGPISPSDGQLIMSPHRKGGRVWDPARGVELFKRGSEEVLARFLKMGSWEDETQ